MIDSAAAAQRYAHGSRARYQLGKCRCFECKVANSNYEAARLEATRASHTMHFAPMTRQYVVRCRATGEIVLRTAERSVAIQRCKALSKKDAPEPDNQLIKTTAVIKHVMELRRAGIGIKAICRESGVNRGVLQRILAGEIKKTRRANAERILAVGTKALPGAAVVDAGPTWALLNRLLGAGYRKAWIAKLLGATVPALQIKKDRVLLSTVHRVAKLYADLYAKDPKIRALGPVEGVTPSAQDVLRTALDRMDADEFARRFARFMEDKGTSTGFNASGAA